MRQRAPPPVVASTSHDVDGCFVASAFIEDEIAENSGALDIVRRYRSAALEVQECGGTPILFQCRALKNLDPSGVVRVFSEVANEVSALLAFELGEMFADFGQIYDLETVKGLIEIPTLLGMKHSSLDRHRSGRGSTCATHGGRSSRSIPGMISRST